MTRPPEPPAGAPPGAGGLAAVIAAHDEAEVLGPALASLRAAAAPPDFLIVVADHCTDATADLARQAGAEVWERQEGEGGKGAALRWLFARGAPSLAAAAYVVVFDADTTVHPDFFVHLRLALAGGADAAQAFVQPVNYANSPAATLAAYSELLSQLADDRLRTRLGWPVPLRGTGMALRTELFSRLQTRLRTQTEDVELSLLLLEQGARVVFVREAVLYDPKPPDAQRVARQRARWLAGLANVWRHYWLLVVRQLGRGPAAWSLFQAILLKPKTLFAAAKFLALAAVLIFPVGLAWRAGAALLLAGDLLYYGLGLGLVPAADRRRFARALLLAPLYGWVWGKSLVTAWRHRGGWLSVRR